MKYDMKAFDLLAETYGNDIRQILTFMQVWSKTSKSLNYSETQLGLVGSKKDETVMITNFDAATKLLNRSEVLISEKMSFNLISFNICKVE